MTDDELWTVTPIPRADVDKSLAKAHADGKAGLIVFGPEPITADRLAALVPDPLRRRTLLDRLCWWRR